MPSNYPEIIELLYNQQFTEALEKLQKLPLDDWESKFLLMRTYNNLDDFSDERFQFGVKTLNEIREESETGRIAILTEILTIYYRTGKESDSIDFIEEGLSWIEDKKIEECDEDFIKHTADMLNNIGIIYSNLGKRDEALEIMKQRIEWLDSTKRLEDQSVTLSNIGYIYHMKGEIQTSLKYQLQALDIAEKGKRSRNIAIYCNNIGSNYGTLGELELSENFIRRAIELSYEVDMPHLRAYSLSSLSNTIYKGGDIEKSLEILEEANLLRKQFQDMNLSTNLVFRLLEINVKLKDMDAVRECFDELREIVKNEDSNSRFREFEKIAEAIILKESSLYRNKIKAEQILRDYLNDKTNTITVLQWKAFLLLSDILIGQLDPENRSEAPEDSEEELIEDLKEMLEGIREQAISEESVDLMIQSLVIEAYLNLVNLQTEKASELFQQASVYSELSGIKAITLELPQGVSEEQDVKHDYSSFSPDVLESLDTIIHSVPRLKIIVLLNSHLKLSFSELQDMTGLTPGNLGKHCNKLVEVGYVFKNKEIVDDKFLTVYELTAEGVSEFDKYRNLLLPFLSV